MAGYSYFEDLAWRDAFLNSAMLLGGMGPVDAPGTDGGKVFAGLDALYAGLVFIVAARIRTRAATPVAQVLLGRRRVAAWRYPKARSASR
jgi:Na+(H+)/acetate symporter ActP